MPESLFEDTKEKLKTIKCFCIKKGSSVVLKPSIDPRWYVGTCWKCDKVHTQKQGKNK